MAALIDGGGRPDAGGSSRPTTNEVKAGGGLRSLDPAFTDLRRAWAQLLQERWSSIVIAPTEPGELAPRVAAVAAEVATILALPSLHVVDAQGASPADVARLRKDVERHVAAGVRVVILIDPPLQQVDGLPLLVSADAVLLLVRLGATRLRAVSQLMEVVRSQRVLGCVTYR